VIKLVVTMQSLLGLFSVLSVASASVIDRVLGPQVVVQAHNGFVNRNPDVIVDPQPNPPAAPHVISRHVSGVGVAHHSGGVAHHTFPAEGSHSVHHSATFVHHVEPQQPEPLPDTCQSDSRAFYVDQYYYQFYECQLPWETARDVCRNSMTDYDGQLVSGGDLVTIKDQDENDWLKEYADLIDFGGYYNGLRFWSRGEDGEKCTADDKFVWGSGYDFSYRNFDSEKPRCSGGKKKRQNCVAVQENGLWDDVACNLPLRFVCKAYRYPTPIRHTAHHAVHSLNSRGFGVAHHQFIGAEGNRPYTFADDNGDVIHGENFGAQDSPLVGHRGPFNSLNHFGDYYNKFGDPKQ